MTPYYINFIAQEICNGLKKEYSIGTFSQYHDEPGEFDTVTDEELIAFIENILNKDLKDLH